MNIRDFIDISKLQAVQDSFSNATGLAAMVVDAKGEQLTEESNFTDFCAKYTRGSDEGNRRCTKCDNECTDVYSCHAGLMDFSIDIKIGDEKVATAIGGQVLPNSPDEEKFRKIASELDIDPDTYIKAVNKVPVMNEKTIRAAAELFGEIVNMFVNLEYSRSSSGGKLGKLQEEINHATEVIQKINTNTHSLKSIANKQKMLSLNASIEAARSGEAGVGFAVVAKSMGDLSSQSATIYGDIDKSVIEVTECIEKLTSLFEAN